MIKGVYWLFGGGMMHVFISLFSSLAIPWGLGYFLIRRYFSSGVLPPWVDAALAYALGMGILTQWMLVLCILGIPLGLFSIGLPLIGLTVILALITKTKDQANLKGRLTEERMHPLGWVMAAYIVYNTGCALWLSWNTPIIEWDAIATAVFKAKIIFFERSLKYQQNFPHADYPLHLPFAEAWVAFNLGEWHSRFIKIIFPATLVCFLSVYYYFLRQWFSRTWSLFGMTLLVSSLFFMYHATISYRDLTLTTYNCTTIILLFLWHRTQSPRILLLAALFAGLTTFVKLEAKGYLVCYVFLLWLMVSDRKSRLWEKAKNFLRFCLPAFGIFLLYQMYKFWTHIPVDPLRSRLDLSWDKLSQISYIVCVFVEEFLCYSANWNMVWILFAVSFISYKQLWRHREMRLLISSVFSFIGLYFFVALLMPNYVSSNGTVAPTVLHNTVFSRVVLHFYPLAIPVIVYSFSLMRFPSGGYSCKDAFQSSGN